MDLFNIALPAFIDGWQLIIQPLVIGYLILGVMLGLAIGIFPGLGGIAGLSLVLPFMFGLDPILGLALMVGMVAVVPTSDTFASVLMGIPGSSASQATVLDGFPMAKKGMAARALSAAFASSLFGGIVGASFLTFFILIARPVVLEFKSPELLMVSAFGLSMVGILAGRVALKGIMAAGVGMLVASIGEGPFNGELRMSSYDVPYFTDGLKLVIVGLGIFAVPEIVALLRKDKAIAERASLGAGWLDGVKDWWQHKWLSVRCALIGVVVGVIPGLGGSVVDWIAYGHTVQTTKDKAGFGKGDVRGVIGPESSNNAKEGGGLVPTLLFGIPGSGSMAIFIGALALLGSGELEVVQVMLKENLDYTYAIVWLLALANVFGTILCIALSGQIAKLTTIRFALIAPFIFMIISFAAFQSGQDLMDLAVLFGIGFLGILMRRFDWSRPAFLIGFVLANPVENYANNASQIAGIRFRQGTEAGFDYIASPIVLTLIVITVISVIIGLRQAKNIRAEGEVASGMKRAPLIFLLCVIGFVLFALFDVATIPSYAFVDAVFPLFVAIVSLICGFVLLVQMRLKPETDPLFADRKQYDSEGENKFGWSTLAWFAGLLMLTSLIGFILALSIFLFSFFSIRARQSAFRTLLLSGAGIGFMCFMAWLLNRDFPPGLLQSAYSLPWPLT
ncbi:MAG: tripartite tricarboxylate transporter permease [Alphaproteobacteria bacterium]|nr:tripartite tricarboxylate transporter permease [Alphaproteobacteria bacterium]